MRVHLFLFFAAAAECNMRITGKQYPHDDKQANCLTEPEAATITENFGKVLYRAEGWSKVAESLIAPDFWHQSDGASFAHSLPLNQTRTRKDFLELERDHQGPLGTWDTHFIGHTCNTITWYRTWLPKVPPIRSMSIIFVDLESRKVDRHYMETNSAALLFQLGRPECEGNFTWSVAQDGLPEDVVGC